MSLDMQTAVRPSHLTSAHQGIPGELSDGCFLGYPRRKRKKTSLLSRPYEMWGQKVRRVRLNVSGMMHHAWFIDIDTAGSSNNKQ